MTTAKYVLIAACVMASACEAQGVIPTAPWPYTGSLPAVRVKAMQFAPDNKALATAGNSAITLWDTATGKMTKQLTGADSDISCFTYSPDGTLIAAGTDKRSPQVIVWKVEDGTVSQTFKNLAGVQAVHFSPDGSKLAVADAAPAKNVTIFNLATKGNDQTLKDFDCPVAALCYSADGKILHTAGSRPGKVTFVVGEGNDGMTEWLAETLTDCVGFNTTTWEQVYRTRLNGGSPNCAYSPDRTYLALVGTGAEVAKPDIARMMNKPTVQYLSTDLLSWRLPNGNDVSELTVSAKYMVGTATSTNLNPGMASIAWSPDRKFIGLPGGLWSNPEGRGAFYLLAKGNARRGSLDMKAASAAFSPDGKWLALAGERSIDIWTVQ
jgi:dipeptidyl aminopeptidase/acylaminoacyl peptidase